MILPRFIRMRDAPAYLGMDKNRFSKEVRIKLTEIPMGVQGIAFDRLELDAWADQYIERNGRRREIKEGDSQWQNTQPASPRRGKSGKSTSGSVVMGDFAKALAQVRSKKQSTT